MATEAGRRTRLDPSVFRLPAEKIREGHYTDAYFNFTRTLLEESGRRRSGRCRSSRKARLGAGRDRRGDAVLKLCAGDWDALEVRASTRATRSPRWRP